MDLISRQAAIDAVVGWFCDLLGVEEISEDLGCLVRLRELPYAQPEHECRTCRYNHLEWSEEPCDSCTSGGESNHWKPKEPEGDPCERCKHRDKDIYEYPCDGCVHGGATCRWEDAYE